MPYVLCPSCHRPVPVSEFLRCEDPCCKHFAQCPECDACIPTVMPAPQEVPHEVLPDPVEA